MISMPASSTSSVSVSASHAFPPRNRRGKFFWKRSFTASKVSRKRLRLVRLILPIASRSWARLLSRSHLLLCEEAEALAQLLVLLDRAEIHVAERLEALAHLVEPRPARLEILRQQRRDLARLAPRVAALRRLRPAHRRRSRPEASPRLRPRRPRSRRCRPRRARAARARTPAASTSPDPRSSVRGRRPRGGRGAARARAAPSSARARLVAPGFELDAHLARRGLLLADLRGQRLAGVALLLAREPRGLLLAQARGERELRLGERARQLLAARLGGLDLRLAARGPTPASPGSGRARARGRCAARWQDSPRLAWWTRRSVAGRLEPRALARRAERGAGRARRARAGAGGAPRAPRRAAPRADRARRRALSNSARCCERSAPRASLRLAERLHALARTLEVLLVARDGERRRVVAIAQVLELVARALAARSRPARARVSSTETSRVERLDLGPELAHLAHARQHAGALALASAADHAVGREHVALARDEGARDAAPAVDRSASARSLDQVHAAEAGPRHRLEAGRAGAPRSSSGAPSGTKPCGSVAAPRSSTNTPRPAPARAQLLERGERAGRRRADEAPRRCSASAPRPRAPRRGSTSNASRTRPAQPERMARAVRQRPSGGAPPRRCPRGARAARAATTSRARLRLAQLARGRAAPRRPGATRPIARSWLRRAPSRSSAHQAIALGQQVAQPLLEVALLAATPASPRPACTSSASSALRSRRSSSARAVGQRGAAGPRCARRASAPRPARDCRVSRSRSSWRSASSAARAPRPRRARSRRLRRPARPRAPTSSSASSASCASACAQLLAAAARARARARRSPRPATRARAARSRSGSRAP